MSIADLLLGKENCKCGTSHKCPIKYVEIGSGVTTKLCESTDGYAHILLVADENTYAVAGAAVEAAVGGRIQARVIFGKELLIPDEAAIRRISENLRDGTDLIVGIGSGVINDLCKYVSYNNGLKYQIVATAPSMDGYASVGAALILGGMKVTVGCRVPEAIIADTDVLTRAPHDMIIAGFGDVIGKYSCLSDWRLASAVRGEYFCEYVAEATMDEVLRVRALTNGIVRHEPDAIAALTEALVAVGILMAYVGNSRPASGSEHHLSHYFEIVGILRGEPYFSHGIDVLYSTAITSILREEVLKSLDFCDTPPTLGEKELEREIRAVYGKISDDVISLGRRVGLHGEREARLCAYKLHRERIKEILRDVPSADEIFGIIREAGLDFSDFVGEYGIEKIAEAVLYSKELKDRYTVLWVFCDIFGYDREKLGHLLGERF